jgi:hypothetical protein
MTEDFNHAMLLVSLTLGTVSLMVFSLFFIFYLRAKRYKLLDPNKSFLQNLWDSPLL